MGYNTIPAADLDRAEACSLDTPHAAPKYYAPDVSQRPQLPADCCAKCRRGTREHGFLRCGYGWACPNGACRHPELTPEQRVEAEARRDALRLAEARELWLTEVGDAC